MAIASAGAGTTAIIFIVIVVVRQVELLHVDGLNGPPLACVACHHLHHHRKHAMPKLMCHVILGIYASQLLQRKVLVDELVVFVQL